MTHEEVKAQSTDSANKVNTMAIIGFILSFITSFIGMIISIIALGKIKKTGEGGKKLAVGGIIIGALMTIIYLVISLIMITGSLAIDKAVLYEEAVMDAHHLMSSYHRVSSLELTPADFNDDVSAQEAYINNAQTIRMVVMETGDMIDRLKENDIFKYDSAAKSLLNNIETKYVDFEATYSEAADIYENASHDDYSLTNSLDTNKLLTNDIIEEINALVDYLNIKRFE